MIRTIYSVSFSGSTATEVYANALRGALEGVAKTYQTGKVVMKAHARLLGASGERKWLALERREMEGTPLGFLTRQAVGQAYMKMQHDITVIRGKGSYTDAERQAMADAITEFYNLLKSWM